MKSEKSGKQPISESQLDDLLSDVQLPSQYIGLEFGSIIREPHKGDIRIALAFHDTYEIGMSYLGFRILYSILNSKQDVYAERVFAPWPDLERRLREKELPLFSLETRTPLSEFDIVGFTLQYELGCTNILTILDLGGIPIRSAERNEKDPFVIAGGPVAFNPEPFSPFFDAFFIGEAEEGFLQIIESIRNSRNAGKDRKDVLKTLSGIKSVYIPALTSLHKSEKNGILYRTKEDGSDLVVERRTISNLNDYPFPSDLIVPYSKVVQDKISVELNRGCARGCRFCQAGYIYLPSRERDPDQVADAVMKSVVENGYDEVSFTGLTPTDYNHLEKLITCLYPSLEAENVSVSLSSVRTEKVPEYMLEAISGLRRTGFTLAPEAGTQRMRDVINKNLSEEQILDSVGRIYKAGWRLIKLYFMIGLPTETEEDLLAIANLAEQAIQTGRKYGIKPEINLSVSPFVPKPHTPFQWERMNRVDEFYKKLNLIKRALRSRGIEFKHHNPELSFLEGLITRGDAAVADVIELAWKKGARFDGWSDFDNIRIWHSALEETAINPDIYLNGCDIDTPLPWNHIKTGVSEAHLLKEKKKASAGKTSSGCRGSGCRICGVCAEDSESKPPSISENNHKPMDSGKDIESPAHDGQTVDEQAPLISNYILYYQRTGLFKYLSHFDTVRTLQRILRRAEVKFDYTKGFHPKPVVSFPPPLPVGVEGANEFFDFTAEAGSIDDNLVSRANRTLPGGLKILSIDGKAEKGSLASLVKGALFSVRLKDELAFETINAYNIRWKELLSGTEPILFSDEKKGHSKEKDLRLLISDLKINLNDRKMTFAVKYLEHGSINPIRFLKGFFSEIADINTIRREKFLFE